MAGVLLLSAATLAACGGNDQNAPAANAGCKPAHANLKTAKSGTLTTSTYTFPPFTNVNGTTVTGAEGGILKEIASMECLSLTGQPLDTGSVVTAAQNGRADIASGNWYCTAARAKVVDLAGPVYGDQIGIISTNGASTFTELQGRAMGTVDGYLWNEEFKKIYGSDLKVYPTPTAMYNDLKAGRIEVAADSFGSATYANKQNGDKWKVVNPAADSRVAASKQPPQVCFPMSKNNQALYNAVNEDLKTLRDNGKLAKILEDNGLSGSAANTGELQLIQ
ncbi:amino acid ABC transporter substrate-binding protein [Planosporangium thailandense]|uniref:Amino acid ABC transporter substrate-binding protein n=1 Tax=Planosporangium thailandense TaxID=765197 RepID=A0ABX0XV27_9ACTN|nr:amino acid ABC transporter substrate-binding protein [Planosporangium thailandense]